VPRYGAVALLAGLAVRGGIPKYLRWRHTHRMHAHKHLAAARLRLRKLFLHQCGSLSRIIQTHDLHISPQGS
jgi:hypothetical protein